MSKNQFLELLVYISPAVFGGLLLLIPATDHIDREPQAILPAPVVQYPSQNIDYDKIDKLMGDHVYDSAVMKVKGHLQVRMELLDEYEEGKPFRMKAFVNSKFPVEYADVKWTLGPGVELVTGVEKDVIYNLNSKTPVEVEASMMKTEDGLPARVFFNVHYELHGKVYAQTGYYSSQHQTTPDKANNKKLMKIAPHKHGDLKVMY